MVTFEKANIEDISAIRQVLKETWIATYGSLFSPEQIDAITGSWHAPDRIAFSINDPNTYMAVAKNEVGNIVGVANTRKRLDILSLDRLYILPSYQGKGIGKELLNRAVDAFAGITAVVLEVEEMNTSAIGFYKRQGFTEQEHVEETVEGVTIQVIRMRKQFETE